MPPLDPIDRLREAVSSEIGRRVPQWARDAVADGIIYRLMQHCWQCNTDVIGSEDELQKIIPGMPKEAIRTLLQEQVIHVTHGEYIMPMAWKEAPEHVRSRWRDTLTDEDRAKMRERAKHASQLIHEEPEPEPEPEPPVDPVEAAGPETSLWGEEIEAKPKTKPNRQPHTQRIIDYWFERYEEKYERKPPFTARDAHHLKSALTAFGGDPVRLEDALGRYLASDEPFFRGHPLSLFINQLARWTQDDPKGRAGTGSRHGLDEDIKPNLL